MVEGVATTIPADLAILRHPDFAGDRALHQVGRGDARPLRHRPRRSRAAPPTATTSRPLVQRQHHRRGQRQALRREDVGARRRRWSPPAGGGAAAKKRSRAAASAGGGAPAAGSGDVDGADAGHDREGARRGRPGRRGRSGRRRARGDEDGEPDHRREGRHGARRSRWPPATPSAPATWSSSSADSSPALVAGCQSPRCLVEDRVAAARGAGTVARAQRRARPRPLDRAVIFSRRRRQRPWARSPRPPAAA